MEAGPYLKVHMSCLIYIPFIQLVGRSCQGWCHVVTAVKSCCLIYIPFIQLTAVKSCDKQPVTCQAHLSSQGTCLTGHVWHVTALELSLYLLLLSGAGAAQLSTTMTVAIISLATCLKSTRNDLQVTCLVVCTIFI